MEEGVRDILARLRAASDAAAVFGPVITAGELRRAYRLAAKRCHPDRWPADGEAAREAFLWLTHWYDVARRELGAGTGDHRAPSATSVRQATINLDHRGRRYADGPVVSFRGDFANVYRAALDGKPVALKVARAAADNDLLAAERTALRHIGRQVDARYAPYFPRLLDGFGYPAGAREADDPPAGAPALAANVLSWVAGAYTLDEIRREYPSGLDPKDVAWIWRRLLVALGAAHRAGFVHGAVLPPHVCVLPDEHGLVLVGWTCAVERGHRVPAISRAYEAWYPKEVMSREPATPATDVAMGARCMGYLLGGDGSGGDTPAAQRALRGFFRGCLLPEPRQRPQDAWALLREFDELLARLWGPRAFHPFAVPALARAVMLCPLWAGRRLPWAAVSGRRVSTTQRRRIGQRWAHRRSLTRLIYSVARPAARGRHTPGSILGAWPCARAVTARNTRPPVR